MKNPFRRKKRPQRQVNKSSDVKVNRYISPRKKRGTETSNKRQAAKRKRLLGKTSVISLVAVIGLVFLWSNSRVTEVVLGAEQEIYQHEIQQHLHRNIFANFKPFISEQSLTADLMEQYPEIESVTIRVPFFGNTLEVEIVKRQAQLVLRTGDGRYYIVDRGGYAYAVFDPAEKNDRVVILSDDTEMVYDLSSNKFLSALTVEFIENTNEILRGFKQYENQTFSYRITDKARVIFVKPSQEKYEVKMQLDRSVVDQTNSLQSALRFYDQEGISPVEFIDVRIDGVVYYK